MQTDVRYRVAMAGALIGAVTVELIGVETARHNEVGLAPSHEHVPEPGREPAMYASNISLAASASATTGTVFAASTTMGATFLRISCAKYWDTVRFDDNPAGLLTAAGFVVVNPTSGTARQPPSSG